MAIVFLALFYAPKVVGGQTLPSLYKVKLAWKKSPSPDVIGYRVYYGTSSGNYTASIVVGKETKATIPGLGNGITYFIAVSAIGPDGKESGVSNEVRFLPGLHESKLRFTTSGSMFLALKGMIGRRYDIEASEDMRSWTLVSTVTMGSSGTGSFADPDAARFPKRFYRTRESK